MILLLLALEAQHLREFDFSDKTLTDELRFDLNALLFSKELVQFFSAAPNDASHG